MKTQNNSNIDETSKQAKKFLSPFWHSVLVGGVPGILIGSMGTLGVKEATAAPETKPNSGQIPVDDDNVEVIQVAHSVNNDMSFSEAFAAARAEVGPGGAFVWHGHVYGTYRADDPEWQEMTAEQRAEHSQLVMSQVHPAPYEPRTDDPEIVPVTPEETGHTSDIEVNVEITDVTFVEGTLDGENATMMAGLGTVNGHDALFVDTDMDGEVDTVAIDLNDNGNIEEGEVLHNPEGLGISTDLLVDFASRPDPETDPHECVYGPPPINEDDFSADL